MTNSRKLGIICVLSSVDWQGPCQVKSENLSDLHVVCSRKSALLVLAILMETRLIADVRPMQCQLRNNTVVNARQVRGLTRFQVFRPLSIR